MKIAIISDSHDNIENINKVLDYLTRQKISRLIHCGDLTSYKTLCYIDRRFAGNVWIVRGNAETYDRAKVPEQFQNNAQKEDIIKIFGKVGEIEIGGVTIGFTHKPEDIKNILDKNYDFVFYGHTHKPWIEIKKYKDKKIIIANPGNIMGQPYGATFAILDTKNKKLELKVLNNI